MNEENNKFVYTYSTEELDEIIAKMQKGIQVLMNDDLKEDVQLRIMELEQEIIDDDEVDEAINHRNELMKKKLEQKKRQATKEDIIVIELSDEQKRVLEEEMSVSIVRRDPDLSYHKRDDELFDSAEKREIYQKLSTVQKCYYNQTDYVNAMNIIMTAIKYSLAHDYPWMTYEEAVKEFNAGHIKFEYCQIPKLYVNWTTTIDDPVMLKGILNGTITMVQKDDSKKPKVKLPKIPAMYEVDITGENEWNQLYAMHQRGYNTPISPIINATIGSFSRFSLPDTNWFYKTKEQAQRAPVEFDWMQDGAGAAYYDLVHGITYDTGDLMDDLMDANNNNLNQSLQGKIEQFMAALKRPVTQQDQLYQSTMVQSKDAATIAMEQSILQSMRNANPNK